MIEKLQRVTEGQYSVMEMGDKINEIIDYLNQPIPYVEPPFGEPRITIGTSPGIIKEPPKNN